MTREEAQIALANLKRYMSGGGVVDRGTNKAIDMAIKALEEQPIRCKDCKHWFKTKKECGRTYRRPTADANDYCSRAERKEGESDG